MIVESLNQFLGDNLNYGMITLFMAIESSFIPFPSEIVIPPAGYLVAQGKLEMLPVLIFSSLGSLIGALINYGIAVFLGRPFIDKLVESKFGKICMLSTSKIEKAETYFKKNGALSTFVGRLIPGIRQLISIPAGLSKMNIKKFIIYTLLGAGIWNTILACIGYFLHSVVSNIDDIPEKANQYGKMGSLIIISILLIIVIIHLLLKRRKKRLMNEKYNEIEKEQNQEE